MVFEVSIDDAGASPRNIRPFSILLDRGGAIRRQSVDVSAESVNEAAALGLSRLRRDEWADQTAPAPNRDHGA